MSFVLKAEEGFMNLFNSYKDDLAGNYGYIDEFDDSDVDILKNALLKSLSKELVNNGFTALITNVQYEKDMTEDEVLLKLDVDFLGGENKGSVKLDVIGDNACEYVVKACKLQGDEDFAEELYNAVFLTKLSK